MPAIVVPRGPRKPGGLEKFLGTVGDITGAATGVANLVTLPKRLRLEQERLDLAETQGELEQQRLDQVTLNNDRDVAGLLLNTIIPQTFNRRNELFDSAERGEFQGLLGIMNGPVDPQLRAAAITVGDVSLDMRERVREAAAISLGIAAEDISDSFVLSERNLQGVLDREKSERAFAFGTDPANAEIMEALDLSAMTREATGIAGDTPEGAQTRTLLDRAVANELIRIDPTTGQVSGMVVSNPSHFMRVAFEENGLEPPPVEFDDPLTGERVFVTQDVWDDLYTSFVAQQISQENNAASTINQAAQSLTQSTGMPLDLAVGFVTGDLSNFDQELVQRYAPILEGTRRVQIAAVSTLMATSPTFKNFVDIIATVGQLGIPEKDRSEVVTALSDVLSRVSPNVIVPRDVSSIERLTGMVGGAFGAGPGDPGPLSFDLSVAGSNQPGAPLEPETAGADLTQAIVNNVEPFLRMNLNRTESQLNEYIQGLVDNGVRDVNGEVILTINPAQAEGIRELFKQLKAEQGN